MNKSKIIKAIALGIALLSVWVTANAMEKADKNRELAEVTMVVPVQSVIEKLKDKEGFIATYTPIDTLVDVGTSKVFDSKSHNLKVKTLKSVIDHIDKWKALRDTFDYEIDGMVVKVDKVALQEQCGATNHHPKWAIAFKFDAKQAASILEKIDFQVGRTGAITPVAKLKPVQPITDHCWIRFILFTSSILS